MPITSAGVVLAVIAVVVGFTLLPEPPSRIITLAASSTTSDSLHPSQTFRFSASAKSVVAAFAENAIDYHLEDQVTAFPDPSLGLGGIVTVTRALPVTVTDGKKTYVVRTWSDTVGALLQEKNIELGADDKISSALATPVGPSSQVTIIRVAITTVTEHQSINFGTVKKDDPTLDKGKTKLSKSGVAGQKELIYEVRREDGVEVSRVLKTTNVTKPAEDEVIMVGTKPVITVRCKYNDLVLDAAIKNNVDADSLCYRMMAESNGNANSIGQGGAHQGLFQYDPSFWVSVSAKAGYAGANIFDAKSQIYTTAWAWAHGYRGRWPNP